MCMWIVHSLCAWLKDHNDFTRNVKWFFERLKYTISLNYRQKCLYENQFSCKIQWENYSPTHKMNFKWNWTLNESELNQLPCILRINYLKLQKVIKKWRVLLNIYISKDYVMKNTLLYDLKCFYHLLFTVGVSQRHMSPRYHFGITKSSYLQIYLYKHFTWNGICIKLICSLLSAG